MVKIGYARLALAVAALGYTTTAFAEGLEPGKQPWDFQSSNRASIAAMIVQKANGTLGGTASATGGGNACGGPSGQVSTATANYTCIILNGNGSYDIQALQDALGGQSASSDTNATANGVPNNELSTVLQALVPHQ